MQRMSHLGSYIGCLASSDARNEAYLQEEAALVRTRADVAKIRIEFLRALKQADDASFAAFIGRPALNDAAHYLKRLREDQARVRDGLPGRRAQASADVAAPLVAR
jgi:oligoendopeptidase F